MTGLKTEGSASGPELDALFRRYYDRLVYFAYQIVQNREQSEDVVQDAFVKYWQFRENIQPTEVSVKGYLYSTVRNGSLNVLRHNKVAEGYQESHPDRRNEAEEAPIVEALISAEVLSGIHAAISSLPEKYRTISILSYLEGKKNREIADQLGMSVNTVKKRKQRTLELLRLKLSPEMFYCLALLLGKI